MQSDLPITARQQMQFRRYRNFCHLQCLSIHLNSAYITLYWFYSCYTTAIWFCPPKRPTEGSVYNCYAFCCFLLIDVTIFLADSSASLVINHMIVTVFTLLCSIPALPQTKPCLVSTIIILYLLLLPL